MPVKPKYTEGEKVLCFHGSMIYEAKCLKVEIKDKEVKYFVHYSGWNKGWDEWAPEARILKYNEANLAKQQDMKKQQESRSRRGTKRKGGDDLGDMCYGSSREHSRDRSRRKRTKPNKLAGPGATTEEVKLHIPDSLKLRLAQDFQAIEEKKLRKLPALPNISKILNDYSSYFEKKENTAKNGVLKDITDGIKLYFNETLGTRLLYESERSQYEQVVEPHLDNEQPSEIYGAEHLMRLFTEFGGLLSCMSTDQEDLSLLTGHLEDVLKYIAENEASVFSDDCYSPSETR